MTASVSEHVLLNRLMRVLLVMLCYFQPHVPWHANIANTCRTPMSVRRTATYAPVLIADVS